MITSLLFAVIFAFFLNCALAAKSTALKDCIINDDDNQLSIILEFDGKVDYHCLLLNDPDRLVVDLNDVALKTKLVATKNTFIKGLRGSDHHHEYLRLVFDLNQKIKYSTAFSKDDHQLTIKITPQDIAKKMTVKEDMATLALPPEPILQAQTHSQSQRIVIVIDPGHGGKDPGAAGPHGAVEKEVVLKISKQLQQMLNDEPGFHAILTRTTDCYISLRKRLSIARKHHADMFIAVHADAYNHSHATGAAVYALSPRGATSEAARWLAEKENESELGGLRVELADKDAILRSVLIDLSQTHTIESSLQIGDTVLRNLGKFAKLHHPRVEQAAFVVLKSPDIPSVLVETGFLSNPDEEEKLTDPTYQHQTAYAIKEGIKQYFTINSKGETWFSDNHQKTQGVAVNNKQRKQAKG